MSDPLAVTVEMEEAPQLQAPVTNSARSEGRLRFGVRETGEATLTLYNVLGQRVATLYGGSPAGGKTQVVQLGADQLAELPSGTYFVQLKAHSVKTQRFVLVR